MKKIKKLRPEMLRNWNHTENKRYIMPASLRTSAHDFINYIIRALFQT
jgi:hypothetical protein